MARNKTSGDNQRKGAIKIRDDKSGKLMDKRLRGHRGDFSDFANIQVVDPIVKPRRMKVETIRKAVRAYYK